MKLSSGEKLILTMLSEIYKHLDVDGDINPDLVKSAISTGNLWGLQEEYQGIFDDEVRPEVVDEVVNILNMWLLIEESYDELSPAEKGRVESEASPFGKHVRFPGFDGNHETTYIGVTRFLIKDLNRFPRFKSYQLNSHCPSLDAHRRMYAVFKPMQESTLDGELSVEQIIEVLKERMHPDARKPS